MTLSGRTVADSASNAVDRAPYLTKTLAVNIFIEKNSLLVRELERNRTSGRKLRRNMSVRDAELCIDTNDEKQCLIFFTKNQAH